MKQTILKAMLILCLALGLGGQALAKHRLVIASEHGILPDSKDKISSRLNQLIEREAADMSEDDTLTIALDHGVYHFYAEDAPRRTVYISNHDQVGERPIGILIENKCNVTLLGNQSVLLFHDRMLPIAVIGSKKTNIYNLSIDFAEPQISQIEIIENKGKAGGITFRPAPWVKWRINAKGYFECYGNNWSNVPMSGIVFNKADYRTAYRISDLDYSTQGAQQVSYNLINAPKWTDERLKPGMIVAMRTYERPNPGIFIDNSTDIGCVMVSVQYADGMGLLAQNSHNVALQLFNVARAGSDVYNLEGSKSPRYFTTQADATHFSGCSGTVSVTDGLFEHMMDDAINVHGLYLKLTKRVDDYTLEGEYKHVQAYGFEWGRVGDPVQFVYSKTFDTHAKKNEIAAIEPVDRPTTLGAKVFRIRFAKRLPEEIRPESAIALENMRKVPSVVFADNVIRNNRARGALFNTPMPVVVRGNHFDHISGSGIVASTDCNQWFESGQTQRLLIEQNTFTDVLTSLYQFTEAVITLHPVIPEPEHQRQPFYGDGKRGILIRDNVFRTFDTPLLFARSVKGLVWEDSNRIEPTKTYPKYHWNQERFRLEYCKDIRLPQ